MDIKLLGTLDKVEPDDLDSVPIIVLNLLKFKSEQSLSSYLDYAANFFRGYASDGADGAEVIYAGDLKEQVQGDIGNWDAVALVRYPNRRMFYDMHRSKEYQSFSHLRENALENGVLWISEANLPYRTQAVDFQGGYFLEEIQSRLLK